MKPFAPAPPLRPHLASVLALALCCVGAALGCNAILGMDERTAASAGLGGSGGTGAEPGGAGTFGGGGSGGIATGGGAIAGGGAGAVGGAPAGGEGGTPHVGGNDFSGDPSVVALYEFENGALSADSIGNNLLTSVNDVAESASGCPQLAGCALFGIGGADWFERLDAVLSDDFPFKTGASPMVVDLTVSLWLQPRAIAAQDVLVGKYNWTNGDYRSWAVAIESTGEILFWKGYSAGAQYETAEFGVPCVNDRWYHVAVTYAESTKRSTIRVWDASSQQQLANDLVHDFAQPTSTSEAAFTIGAEWQGSHAFEGQLDEVVIFSRVLSPDEIDQIRQGVYGGPS
jgi:hypothetical protein